MHCGVRYAFQRGNLPSHIFGTRKSPKSSDGNAHCHIRCGHRKIGFRNRYGQHCATRAHFRVHLSNFAFAGSFADPGVHCYGSKRQPESRRYLESDTVGKRVLASLRNIVRD